MIIIDDHSSDGGVGDGDGGVGDGDGDGDDDDGDGDDDALVQSSHQHLVLPVNDAFHHMAAPTPILPYTSRQQVGQKRCML